MQSVNSLLHMGLYVLPAVAHENVGMKFEVDKHLDTHWKMIGQTNIFISYFVLMSSMGS